MELDHSRHLSIFNPYKFGRRRIDIIGVGATGSRITLSLAKLGITNIHIWDFDKVSEENISNQIYGLNDIGEYKVKALADLIKNNTGITIKKHRKEVKTEDLGIVVFLLTDTMTSRKEIFEKSIKNKININLVIETRMDSDNGRIYCFNPLSPLHTSKWEETLYDDDKTVESLCGTSISVGPTAEMISSLAVWQFIRWINFINNNDAEKPENEIIFKLRSPMFINRNF